MIGEKMRLTNSLLIPLVIVLLISASKSEIPIYPEENPEDWMEHHKQHDSTSKILERKEPTNFGLINPNSTNKVADENILDGLLKQADKRFDEGINDIDFSPAERKKLKEFIHNSIGSKNADELKQYADLIIRNTEILIKNYQEQDTTCKADKEALGNDNYTQINKDCFASFIKWICPLYPFC